MKTPLQIQPAADRVLIMKIISPTTMVSLKSNIFDRVWDFHDPNKPRLGGLTHSKLCVDFEATLSGIAYNLPPLVVRDMQCSAALYLKAPRSLGFKQSESAPHSVCQSVKIGLSFFSHLFEKFFSRELEIPQLKNRLSLSDVSISMIEDALVDFDFVRKDVVRNTLRALASYAGKLACAHPVAWTWADVDNLRFSTSNKRTDYERVYPAQLFKLINETASADIIGFLQFMRVQPTTANLPGTAPPFSSEARVTHSAFTAYAAIREKDRKYAYTTGKRQNDTRGERIKFVKKFGFNVEIFKEYLMRVRGAAFNIVAFYTAGRYCDAKMFKEGCIKEICGELYLFGTKVKHTPVDAPIDGDVWPVIPILKDAVTVLEIFCTITFNQYLLCSFESVMPDQIPEPLTDAGMLAVFQKYVATIDLDDVWSHINVSANRYRHTMAYQLARGDVGLSYISWFLKHLNYRFSSTPAQVTHAYGDIDKLMAERAIYRTAHERNTAANLYSPNAPIAGGGAAEFQKRREEFFSGCMAAGMTEEEVLDMLVSQGMPFTNVGLGYCGGKRDLIDANGKKHPPPCTGSLQCNPNICKNSIITNSHAKLWIKVAEVNEANSKNPKLKHQKQNLLKTAAEAREVLSLLGIEL